MTRLEQLSGYVTGEMTDADADAFEEAMFDAPDEADVVFLDRIARHGQTLIEHGTWDIGVTRAHVESLIEKGYRVHVFDAGPPGVRTSTFDPGAELMVTKLNLGRIDVERVDVEIFIVGHDLTKTIKDALVERDGIIYGLCEKPLAQIAFGAGRTITKVRRTDGAREVLAEWDLLPAE